MSDASKDNQPYPQEALAKRLDQLMESKSESTTDEKIDSWLDSMSPSDQLAEKVPLSRNIGISHDRTRGLRASLGLSRKDSNKSAPKEDALVFSAAKLSIAPSAEKEIESEIQTKPEPLPESAPESFATGTAIDDAYIEPVMIGMGSDKDGGVPVIMDDMIKASAGRFARLKRRALDVFQLWWANKPVRYGSLGGLCLLIFLGSVVPATRYMVLNAAGVRADASVAVLDRTNNQPLKNVTVKFNDKTAKTDKNGVVRLEGLPLGRQMLTIEQLGFSKINRPVTLGFGSNPLGDIQLKAVGMQFKFQLSDYLSSKPVINAEVTMGGSTAKPNIKGEAVLTVGSTYEKDMVIDVVANGYRTEQIKVEQAKKDITKLALVNSRPHLFISKQSGKFDVYRSDLDGKNRKVLLPGTGIENDRLALVADPTSKFAALVSSREDKRNQDGFVLQTLTLLNVDDGAALTLENSERIQLVGWTKDRLVYVKVKAGTSAGNPERHQLISYNIQNSTRLVLANANFFTDVMIARGVVYYTAANNYPGGQSQFASVNSDNTGKQVILNEEIWNISRTNYDDLSLSGNQKWYSYRIGDKVAKKLPTPPGNYNETRFYLDAPEGLNALWTDGRDGKGVLLLYNAATKKDKTLVTQTGLTYPLRWLDNKTLIFRIATPQETADYTLSIDGGASKKISDVTNSAGLGTWFYY